MLTIKLMGTGNIEINTILFSKELANFHNFCKVSPRGILMKDLDLEGKIYT